MREEGGIYNSKADSSTTVAVVIIVGVLGRQC